jgi:hypothetical protein
MTKTCTKCGTEKWLELFYKNKNKPDGLHPWCKSCQRAYYAEKVRGDKDYFLKYQRINRREKTARVAAVRSQGCADCGENHPAVLEFHHVDPRDKSETIAQMVALNRNWKRIEAEIAKCVVLCCNCHRKRHYNEKTAAKLVA